MQFSRSYGIYDKFTCCFIAVFFKGNNLIDPAHVKVPLLIFLLRVDCLNREGNFQTLEMKINIFINFVNYKTWNVNVTCLFFNYSTWSSLKGRISENMKCLSKNMDWINQNVENVWQCFIYLNCTTWVIKLRAHLKRG